MKRLSVLLLLSLVAVYGAGFTAISKTIEYAGIYDQHQAITPDSSVYNLLFKIDSFDLKIVPPSSGVQFYKNGIVFLGISREFSKMVPIHVSFGNIQAFAATLGDSSILNPAIFSPTFAFSYPCDAISFSSNYGKMYFTMQGKKDGSAKIYESDYVPRGRNRGGWTEAFTPMNFCTGNSVYTHPAVSADGKLMVFASDRAGTAGGMDLFVTRKTGERWSNPESLGKLINTKSNELYPYLDQSNNLYFSSEGQPGYGGYDVFVSKFNGTGWDVPLNLTGLINSANDDVAFTLNRENGKVGFYSSIQKNEDRDGQLYKINFGDQSVTGSLANLSEAFLSMARSDTSFLSGRKLIAKTDEFEKAAKATELAKVEENARAAERIKADEIAKATEKARAEEAVREAERARAEEKAKLAKADVVKSITVVPEKFKDVVVYRVQFLSSVNLQNLKQVESNRNIYTPYIYFYKNEYRYTAGEFTTLEPARELQFALRKSGYPQAFVAAFKNNLRSLDLSLFTQAAEAAKAAEAAERTSAELADRFTRTGAETEKPIATAPQEPAERVVYRVQFLASATPNSRSQITAGGANYSTFEYLYNGAYRICAGEFNTLTSAREFQNILRKSGFPQAFVVAFKNNVRSLDAALFR